MSGHGNWHVFRNFIGKGDMTIELYPKYNIILNAYQVQEWWIIVGIKSKEQLYGNYYK